MSTLSRLLELDRCPHCRVDIPQLFLLNGPSETVGVDQIYRRWWACYACHRCGGVVLACASAPEMPVVAHYPKAAPGISKEIPERARRFLEDAARALSAPSASIMAAASGIDAMLKDKSYVRGSLNERIDQAAADHVITTDVAKWAHHVRLDANDQRHADVSTQHPSTADAETCLEFALALGEILYVLPARVTHGLNRVSNSGGGAGGSKLPSR